MAGNHLVDRRRRTDGEDGDVDDASIISSVASDESAQPSLDKENASSDNISEPASHGTKQASPNAKIVSDDERPATAMNKTSSQKHMSTDSAVVFTNTQFDIPADTAIMISLSQPSTDGVNPIAFDDMDRDNATPVSTVQSDSISGGRETVPERRKREHEEYKRKRDSDPAFVPTRGNFFMHDARASTQKISVFGRERGSRFNGGLADSKWTHDLHEVVNEPRHPRASNGPVTQNRSQSQSQVRPRPQAKGQVQGQGQVDARAQTPSVPQSRPETANQKSNPSTTTLLGNVQIRVFLPGMVQQTRLSAAAYSHTRLPDLRSPLRRDKAVRVSLPCKTPTYVLPAASRSFVFIPWALRSKQPSLRGSVVLGPNSRQASLHGGSRYSSSVNDSRRSSMVQSRMGQEPFESKPVVRLPLTGPSNEGAVDTYPPKSQGPTPVNDIAPQAALSLTIPPNTAAQPFENQIPREYLIDHSPATTGLQSELPSAIDLYNTYSVPHSAMGHPAFLPPHPEQTNGGVPPYFAAPFPSMHFSQTPMDVYHAHPSLGEYMPSHEFAAPPPMGPGMMAHETNGMVYYIEQGQAPLGPSGGDFAPPAQFGDAMMAPGGDGALYYPPPPFKGMMHDFSPIA